MLQNCVCKGVYEIMEEECFSRTMKRLQHYKRIRNIYLMQIDHLKTALDQLNEDIRKLENTTR